MSAFFDVWKAYKEICGGATLTREDRLAVLQDLEARIREDERVRVARLLMHQDNAQAAVLSYMESVVRDTNAAPQVPDVREAPGKTMTSSPAVTALRGKYRDSFSPVDEFLASRREPTEDTARLDWLERNHTLLNHAQGGRAHVCSMDGYGEYVHYYGETYREAIDNAMYGRDGSRD